jgi:hypothetical protein
MPDAMRPRDESAPAAAVIATLGRGIELAGERHDAGPVRPRQPAAGAAKIALALGDATREGHEWRCRCLPPEAGRAVHSPEVRYVARVGPEAPDCKTAQNSPAKNQRVTGVSQNDIGAPQARSTRALPPTGPPKENARTCEVRASCQRIPKNPNKGFIP